jgi:hypothetical protein
MDKAYADHYDITHPPAYKIACDDTRQRFEEYQKEREEKIKQYKLTCIMLQKEKVKPTTPLPSLPPLPSYLTDSS